MDRERDEAKAKSALTPNSSTQDKFAASVRDNTPTAKPATTSTLDIHTDIVDTTRVNTDTINTSDINNTANNNVNNNVTDGSITDEDIANNNILPGSGLYDDTNNK